MMHAKPQKQHQWLENLLGDWTYETEAPAQAGQPASKATGTETVRSIGGLGYRPRAAARCRRRPCHERDDPRLRHAAAALRRLVDRLDDDVPVGVRRRARCVRTRVDADSEGPSFSGDGSMSSTRT